MNSQDFDYLLREIESIRRELGAGIPVPEKKASSGGTGLIMARVIGGNPSSGANTPFGRPFLHATPYYDSDGVLVQYPTIDDWEDLAISNAFVEGTDPIPGHPDGIGIAALLRPYSVGNSSWNRSSDTPIILAASPASINAAYILESGNKLKVYGSSANVTVKPSGATFTVMNGQTPVTVQSYTQTDYGASITLASAVADGVESLTVSWLAGDFLDGQTALAAGSIVAGRIGAKYTFINVINNTGAQGFGYGDYVVVDVTPVPITDKQNPAVSKTCYRVIGSMTAGVLHNHAGLGVLGQGTAPAILGA